jgi:hypothetical protein
VVSAVAGGVGVMLVVGIVGVAVAWCPAGMEEGGHRVVRWFEV